MKVIGIMHKVGTFKDAATDQDVHFNNFELHCICSDYEMPTDFTAGSAVSVLKIKAADYSASCNAAKIGSPVGYDISPLYQVSGHYAKCTGFRVIGKSSD